MDFIDVGGRRVSVRHIRAYETFPEDQGESDIDRIRVSRLWIEGEAEPVSVTTLVYAGWIEQRGPVVPAAPGAVALSYSWTETGYEIERSPIVAWRIIHSTWTPWAQPVTFGALARHGMDDPAFKAPDGTVWGTANQSWPDEEAWAQEMRRQADADEAYARSQLESDEGSGQPTR